MFLGIIEEREMNNQTKEHFLNFIANLYDQLYTLVSAFWVTFDDFQSYFSQILSQILVASNFSKFEFSFVQLHPLI